MSKLTMQRIKCIAHFSDNPTAVENFLSTLNGMTQAEALANLELDARAYHWRTSTCRAIQMGIMEARLG